MRRLYVGLDSSTQSLTAIAIEVDGDSARIVAEDSIAFDEALPQYGTRHGVLPSDDPAVATSSPSMWADALDLMFTRLAQSGLDLSPLAAFRSRHPLRPVAAGRGHRRPLFHAPCLCARCARERSRDPPRLACAAR